MSRRKSKPKQRRAKSQSTTPLSGRDGSQRLHLRVLRDPVSGRANVGLRAPLFTERWQNDLTVSTASTALTTLQQNVSIKNVVALAQHAMSITSKLAEGLTARAANGTVACKAGCDHCCYQSVGVTPAEALAITDHLERTLLPATLAELIRRLGEAQERTRGLSPAERYSPAHPCPFLQSAECSIYEVRPLSCRGMNSLDADQCKRQLYDAEVRAAFLDSGSGSQSFMEPIRAFHAISAGLQLGLSELFGLDMRPLELTAAVHELLTCPTTIRERWLQGEASLEAARGGDTSANATARVASGLAGTPRAVR